MPASQKVTTDATEAVDCNLACFTLGFDSIRNRSLKRERERERKNERELMKC
jgi:hypothetical protein